ncbi:MAG: hypothetical protein ACM3PZ_03495 [Bacillota bacterium]
MSEKKLAVKKDKDRPKIDDIFNAFRNRKHLFIKAKLSKSDEELHCSFKGWNIYEIKIFSIELLYNDDNHVPDKGDYIFDYKLTGQLIAVNGENSFPENFAWKSGGLKRAIYLEFSTSNRMELIYDTDITLIE